MGGRSAAGLRTGLLSHPTLAKTARAVTGLIEIKGRGLKFKGKAKPMHGFPRFVFRSANGDGLVASPACQFLLALELTPAYTSTTRKLSSSPLEQIHRRRHVVHAKILSQRRIFPRHGLIHRISHIAVGHMPRRRGAQF